MKPKSTPGNGYKIAAIVLLAYGIFSFFFVAIPAFSTAVSSGIVSVFVCVACIVAGGICWHKYISLQKDHRSKASVNPNLPLTGSPKANATSAAQTKTKNDFIPAQNPSAMKPQKIIAQPTRPGKSVIKNAISSTTKNFYVTGISHYMDALLSLGYENPDYDLSKRELIDAGLIGERIYELAFDPVKVDLVPEPNNPADKNAIQVFVDGAMVGYIKKGSCSQVKNLLASDAFVGASCDIFGGKYKIIHEDYNEETEKETYELERAETSYKITVHIKLK